MIDGVSSAEQSQATSQVQANLIAVRNEAQNQQQLANVLQQESQRAQDQVQASSNPEGVGQNVDTYA
ncbi:MAG: hypothetical protein H6935_07160 [Thiobacillus sp.]|nr:hypothetical protein [Thiobacillus sp.]